MKRPGLSHPILLSPPHSHTLPSSQPASQPGRQTARRSHTRIHSHTADLSSICSRMHGFSSPKEKGACGAAEPCLVIRGYVHYHTHASRLLKKLPLFLQVHVRTYSMPMLTVAQASPSFLPSHFQSSPHPMVFVAPRSKNEDASSPGAIADVLFGSSSGGCTVITPGTRTRRATRTVALAIFGNASGNAMDGGNDNAPVGAGAGSS